MDLTLLKYFSFNSLIIIALCCHGRRLTVILPLSSTVKMHPLNANNHG